MAEGRIIVLNGTSSSGKSSLLKALQELLDEPYLDAGIDRFIWMLPRRYLQQPLWDDVLGSADHAGETGRRLVSGMHHAAVALARTGNNVLIDHVLVEPAWVREAAVLFAPLPAYLIGVRCPLAVLEQREQARADRTLGQARKQAALVHAYEVYDLEVDTSRLRPEEGARLIRQRLETAPFAFRQLAARLSVRA